MKIINRIVALILLSVAACAEDQLQVEIVEFGIYSGTDGYSVADSSAPTGQRFMDGQIKLTEQTDRIPAVLGAKFGFGFNVKGNNGQPVPLTVIYHFPKMTNPQTHQESAQYKINIKTKPSEACPHILWDFTEPWELVPGEWVFQLYQGQNKLAEKKFTVIKP